MVVLVTRDDKNGIAYLTLNRPEKLNALNVALFGELETHLEQLEQQIDDIGVVVLRGAGKCFSAGHDLGDIAEGEALPKPGFQALIIERLAKLPQPVISAVHGHCYTGALEVALAGDIILASETAKFADTHAKWALTPVWGMSQRLPRRIGQAKANEMMFSARTYSGREAEQMGLCNICYSDEAFDAEVEAFCRTVLENSWFSLRAIKKLQYDTDGMSLDAGLAHEVYKSEGRGEEMQERVSGFLKK